MLAGRGKRLNEQNANSRKLDQGHEGKQGILMEKFYLGSQIGISFCGSFIVATDVRKR